MIYCNIFYYNILFYCLFVIYFRVAEMLNFRKRNGDVQQQNWEGKSTAKCIYFCGFTGRPKPVNDGFHVVIHPNNGFAIDFGIILHNWRIQKHGRSTEPNKIRFRNSKKEAEKHRIIGLETLAPI